MVEEIVPAELEMQDQRQTGWYTPTTTTMTGRAHFWARGEARPLCNSIIKEMAPSGESDLRCRKCEAVLRRRPRSVT